MHASFAHRTFEEVVVPSNDTFANLAFLTFLIFAFVLVSWSGLILSPRVVPGRTPVRWDPLTEEIAAGWIPACQTFPFLFLSGRQVREFEPLLPRTFLVFVEVYFAFVATETFCSFPNADVALIAFLRRFRCFFFVDC